MNGVAAMPSNFPPLAVPGTPPREVRRRIVTPGLLILAFTLGAACVLVFFEKLGGQSAGVPLSLVLLLLLGAAAYVTLSGQVGRPIEVLASTLQFSEARHQSFWTHSPDCLFMVEVTDDERFVFGGVNPAHERLTGLVCSEIRGKEPSECLPPEVAVAITGRYRTCVRRGSPISYEEELTLPFGRRLWRTSLAPVRDPRTGRITLLLGSGRDLTPDLEARAELQHLNDRLHSILASVSDCYCTFDRDYRVTAINSAALTWLGLSEKAALGQSFADIYAGPYECSKVTRHVMEHRTPAHVEVPSGLRPGRWLDYHVYPSEEGVSVFFRDITQAKEAREALDEISRQLLTVQEEERRRMASELHDSTAQHLVSAELNLMRLSSSSGQTADIIREEIGVSLDEALKEIRVFTYLLHPPGLHSNGLEPTLRTFVDGFARRTGLEVTFLGDPAALGDLSQDLQRSVLRIVQEALSNTHRHAEASRVAVHVKLLWGALFVRIQDDGCGMLDGNDGLSADTGTRLGVGIPGMRARLRQFGGDLRIRSRLGRTSLLASVPLGQARRLDQPRDPGLISASGVDKLNRPVSVVRGP